VGLESHDGQARLQVSARVCEQVPATSVFDSLAEASRFFERGSLGYSMTDTAGRFDGLELRVENWRVDALVVDHVSSSYFEDEETFPSGSVAFDCALLMRGIEHEWHARESLCCPEAEGP
jgi:hypothetical protein